MMKLHSKLFLTNITPGCIISFLNLSLWMILLKILCKTHFLLLWDKRHELKVDSNLNAYLFTVARNNCLYKLRDQRYRQKLFTTNSLDQNELELNMEVLSTLDSSAYTFDEIDRIIERTLEELPPQCKKVFILSRFEERKNKEIAEELNISVKVVEKHISKGLKRFKVSLKDYLPFVAYLFVP